MNNRKQKNKRGKNPRQHMMQIIKANTKKDKEENKVRHLTHHQQ
jgi:hypothetical protein